MGGETSTAPPNGRLLVNVVEQFAATEPEKVLAYVPNSDDPRDGWKPVTFGQFARGMDQLAHMIASRQRHSLEDPEFPAIAYVGPNDTRYMMFQLACIKARCQAFLPSPRNSKEAFSALFYKTNTRHFWAPESHAKTAASWVGDREIVLVTVPSQDDLLQSSPEPFPYGRTLEEAQWDPLVVLHTSGSTGLPKPIFVRQGTSILGDVALSWPDLNGETLLLKALTGGATKIFQGFPLFHAAGNYLFFTAAIYAGKSMVLPIAGKPLSTDVVLDSIKYSGADSACMPPSIIEDGCKTDAGFKILSNLRYLCYGGGSLNASIGDALTESHGVSVQNYIASTEHYPYGCHVHTNRKLWRYFHFNSDIMGIDWQPSGETPGEFELVIKRKDPNGPADQAVFYTFPDLHEFHTSDIFKRHPTAPDHWEYIGRRDNIIVFSNGEKLNPVTIEDGVAAHPSLKGVLVVGAKRFQAAMIIEPNKALQNDEEREALIQDVWPLIEKMNKQTVAHGRIDRQLVAVSDPSIPFPRADKGTIQRSAAGKLYADFIDALYKKADMAEASAATPLDFTSRDSLAGDLLKLFSSRLGVKGLKVGDDFFTAGLDSLQVMTASKAAMASIAATKGVELNPTTAEARAIYANPSIERLAAHLMSNIGQRALTAEEEHQAQVETTQRLLNKYTADLSGSKPAPADDAQTIVVTGTTGSLGCYLLHQLISLPQIKKIIALNRGQDGGKSRQGPSMEERGLTTDFTKVEFLQTDVSVLDLGLGDSKYNELLQSVDRIIHNAWPVNFNISVETFEPHIRGVRNLVSFSTKAKKQVPIIFTSTISTVMNWNEKGAVPEQRFEDLGLAHLGYGQSKLIGSLILDAAAPQVPAASIRVGQIAGPRGEKGMWNKQEFLPSLIASSLHLGLLPYDIGPQGVIDWTPIDDIASIVLDVAGITTPVPVSSISGYYHAVNPNSVSWTSAVAAIHNHYGQRIKRLVSLEEWVSALEASAKEGTADVAANPGIKLIDTYKGMLWAQKSGQHRAMAMSRTAERSPTVQKMGPVSVELIENWCRQWAF